MNNHVHSAPQRKEERKRKRIYTKEMSTITINTTTLTCTIHKSLDGLEKFRKYIWASMA